jgi:4,5-DOPA dioxygenase extradiol
MHERLMSRDEAALAGYRLAAPHAVLAQPTEEHFMPLFVAYGAGGDRVERLHSSATFGHCGWMPIALGRSCVGG